MKKIVIYIQGMHCASCASNIEKSLSKINGIKNIRVNVIMKKGYAEIEDNVKEEDIKNAVKKAGYTATKLEYE
ncbi:heavy-metal-associated domain-containing protein [Candidatus Woesearchaeota archaeon]|nr:MAG: Cu2+-exporting ATPase [archaeon GW2011_AR18]MBS3162131.1 heavy-metal-associated domain-containing protein [Candidatus Woesearchaeota archaeon]HIH25239.1 heavy-metal-associated domain-containing protein [Nanoarchaeota archaeon]